MYIKNIKYTRIFSKIFLIFLYILLPLYGLCENNVSYSEPVFSTSIYRFNLINTECHSVSANPNNIIYVSNDEGILVFNGISWNLIPLPERCFYIAGENNQLYFIGETFIGHIVNGKLGYSKIQLPYKLNGSENPRLVISDNGLYLLVKSSLYYLDNSLKLLNNECSDIVLYKGSPYILDARNSLYKLNGRQTEFISEFGQNTDVLGFVKSESNLWIKSGNAVIIVNPVNKTYKTRAIDSSLQSLKYSRCSSLKDNKLLIVDSSQHVSYYNFLTNRETNLEFSNPLTNFVKDVFVDKEGNIWMLSNEGIVRISLCTSAISYSGIKNLKGPLFSYLDKYLVYKDHDKINLILQDSVANTYSLPDSSFSVFPVGTRFVCYNYDKIIDLSVQGTIQNIDMGSVSAIFPSYLNYSGFYCIIDNRLKHYYYLNNKWIQKTILKSIEYSLKSLVEIDQTHLLLLTNTGVLLKINSQNQIPPTLLTVKGKTQINQTWKSIAKNNDKIFLLNYHSVFEYQSNTDSCIEISCLKKKFGESTLINLFIPLANKSAIISVHPIGSTKQDVYFIKDYGKHQPENYIRITSRLFEFGNISQVLVYGKNMAIIKGDQRTLKIDIPSFINEQRSKGPILSKIIISPDDSVVYENQAGFSLPIDYFTFNDKIDYIKFELASTGYKSESEIKFAFKLEGYDKNWSDWQSSSTKTFSKLGSGNYKLLVKAMQNNGQISDTLSINIHVKAPFYVSATAIKIYSILAIILAIFLYVTRKRKFEKEKTNLENIINKRTAELQREKEVTEELLANILPKDTVNQLKNTGKASSQKFELVTVLFSDIEGFTRIAEQMNPEMLIDELDNFFFHFDSVVEKYNIEKIKTIGDAYMCAGGIPYKNRTNPVEVVLAALEMQDYMRQLKQKEINIWDLRIGIHTGAVIAGVVGHKKLSYDIWGDTVNTASRMESSGEPAKINISGHTYELVKDFFVCEYRGKMPVKYKGDIDMYFVKAIRPELSVDLKVIPNKKFFIQLQLLRLHDLEEFVLERLTDELSDKYTFHTTKRAKDIHTLTELIARAEGISPEEMLFVRTTALLIDSGVINSYSNYLIESMKFAREILPKFRYSGEQIEIICTLILNIEAIMEKQGKLESILSDAYLNYYGRVDFLEIKLNQLKEIKLFEPDINENEWWNEQLDTIRNFRFKTSTGQLLREVSAEKQVEKVREYLNLF